MTQWHSERAKSLIALKKIERSELALQCGLKEGSLDNCLRDSNPLKPGTAALILMAKALGTTVAYLTGETDDPNPKEAA